MRTIDLYNLSTPELLNLVQIIKNNPSEMEEVLGSSLRLQYNLNSLLISFPKGNGKTRVEIEEAVSKLAIVITSIKDELKLKS